MFILIPAVIIFLCVAYLSVNDDLSIYTESLIYFLITVVSCISLFLYKNIKKNMKQQEINKIKIEIYELEKKLQNTTDETYIKTINDKINRLKDEIIEN